MKIHTKTGIIVLISLMLLMLLGINVSSSTDTVSMVLNLIFAGIYIFFIVAVFAFWLSMLIDCLQRPAGQFPNRGEFDKLLWVLVILFLHFFGALFYYYLVYKRIPR